MAGLLVREQGSPPRMGARAWAPALGVSPNLELTVGSGGD